ncbi:unnamed protein product [Prunus armeniaca]
MASEGRSRSPSSQVPLYLWGDSQVPKESFVANLHRVTTEAQFKMWCELFDSGIPKDVHVKLAKPLSDSVPRVDSNNLGARIITFRPFYFSLGFTFSMSKFFRDVLCAMECALSQCTLNVYRVVICFENLSRFFKLDLTVREFFYFFEVRCFEKYAQVRARKAKLFDSLSQGDHVARTCWKLVAYGKGRLATILSFLSPIVMRMPSKISYFLSILRGDLAHGKPEIADAKSLLSKLSAPSVISTFVVVYFAKNLEHLRVSMLPFM